MASRLRCTRFPDRVRRSNDMPRWYLTSPLPSTSSLRPAPWNSAKMRSIGLRTTFASTFRRPRCGIPSTQYSTPRSHAVSIISFMEIMRSETVSSRISAASSSATKGIPMNVSGSSNSSLSK